MVRVCRWTLFIKTRAERDTCRRITTKTNVGKNKFDKTSVGNLEMFESTSLRYWNSGFSSKKVRSGLILLLEDDHFHIIMQPSWQHPAFFLSSLFKECRFWGYMILQWLFYQTSEAIRRHKSGAYGVYFCQFFWFHDRASNLLIQKTVGGWLTQNTPAVATPVRFRAEIFQRLRKVATHLHILHFYGTFLIVFLLSLYFVYVHVFTDLVTHFSQSTGFEVCYTRVCSFDSIFDCLILAVN